MKSSMKVVAVLLMLTSCESSFLSSGNNGPPILLNLDLTSENIKTFQDIEADFTVTNISFDEVTLIFSSSCQYGFEIERNDDTVFNSRNVLGCLGLITELTLAPEKSKTYRISLRGMSGSDSLEAGAYQMKAFLLNEKSPQVETSFVVK